MTVLVCDDFRRVYPNLRCCDPCHKHMGKRSEFVDDSPCGPPGPDGDPDQSFEIKARMCCGMEIKKRTKDDFELAALMKDEAENQQPMKVGK